MEEYFILGGRRGGVLYHGRKDDGEYFNLKRLRVFYSGREERDRT